VGKEHHRLQRRRSVCQGSLAAATRMPVHGEHRFGSGSRDVCSSTPARPGRQAAISCRQPVGSTARLPPAPTCITACGYGGTSQHNVSNSVRCAGGGRAWAQQSGTGSPRQPSVEMPVAVGPGGMHRLGEVDRPPPALHSPTTAATCEGHTGINVLRHALSATGRQNASCSFNARARLWGT